jgi:predicted transcriptional regulator
MKTAVSLPDDIYEEMERLARERNVPRDELYAEALREYVARRGARALTDAIDRALEGAGADADPGLSAAARRTLERSEW